ncbi:SBBP repeat-containing protein, partial [Deltaproteobacteria bacterium]|nr:SBBP repeat-containing protein [Deltaproteobacteria bacterium]
DSSCSGSIQLSSDQFNTCVQMSSDPIITDLNKQIQIIPNSQLTKSSTYKVKVTTNVKDAVGNPLSNDYVDNSGFTVNSLTYQSGTSTGDLADSVISDSSNNLFVIGRTTGNFNGNTNSGNYNQDTFLIKFNTDLEPIWTKQYNFSGGIQDIASGSQGNLYLSGSLSTGPTLVVKLDSGGSKVWEESLSSDEPTSQYSYVNQNYLYSIDADANNNLYATGYTRGNFDSHTNTGPDTTHSHITNYYNDIILIKYNSSGVKQWSKQISGTRIEEGIGVIVDSSDNIILIGKTNSSLDGNNYSLCGSHVPWNQYDIFVAKYNSDGTKLWSKQFDSGEVSSTCKPPVNDEPKDIALDSNNNIYITGTTAGKFDDDFIINGNSLFLMKLDSSGNKLWVKQSSSICGNTEGRNITIDSNNNIYLTGHSPCTIDSLVPNGGTGGHDDIVIIKYNSNGIKQWTKLSGSSNRDFSASMSNDTNGNVYITGYAHGNLDGNKHQGGGQDMILIKYNSSGVKQ